MESLTLSGPLSSKLLLFLGGGLQWQQLQKHLVPPTPIPTPSLSVFSCWTLTVSELTYRLSTRLEDCGHFPLCHLQLNVKPRGHNQDMIPVTMGHQMWTEDFIFLTCSTLSDQEVCQTTNQTRETRNKSWRVSQSLVTVLQSNKRNIRHFYASENNLKEGQKSYEFTDASLNILRTSFLSHHHNSDRMI